MVETLKYYYLMHGDAIEIGDEFKKSDGSWEVFTEAEYRQWHTYRAHYYENEDMSPFRRSLNKDPTLSKLTEEIYLSSFKTIIN